MLIKSLRYWSILFLFLFIYFFISIDVVFAIDAGCSEGYPDCLGSTVHDFVTGCYWNGTSCCTKWNGGSCGDPGQASDVSCTGDYCDALVNTKTCDEDGDGTITQVECLGGPHNDYNLINCCGRA